MPVATTIKIPDRLYAELQRRAAESGSSLEALVVQTLDASYPDRVRDVGETGKRIQLPLIRMKGKPGPLFPTDENPYDLIFP